MPVMDCPRQCAVGHLEYEVDTGPDSLACPVVGISAWSVGGGLVETECGCTWGDDEFSALEALAVAAYTVALDAALASEVAAAFRGDAAQIVVTLDGGA